MGKSTGEFEVVGSNIVPVTVDDVVASTEASECADIYLDTLTMERCEGQEHTLELVSMPEVEPEMTEVHIDDVYFDSLLTEKAECVKDIPNGWTLEELIALLTKSNVIEHM